MTRQTTSGYGTTTGKLVILDDELRTINRRKTDGGIRTEFIKAKKHWSWVGRVTPSLSSSIIIVRTTTKGSARTEISTGLRGRIRILRVTDDFVTGTVGEDSIKLNRTSLIARVGVQSVSVLQEPVTVGVLGSVSFGVFTSRSS